MAIEKGIAHRPGLFKQTNKEHKHGRHRSKGSISSSAKGVEILIFFQTYVIYAIFRKSFSESAFKKSKERLEQRAKASSSVANQTKET